MKTTSQEFNGKFPDAIQIVHFPEASEEGFSQVTNGQAFDQENGEPAINIQGGNSPIPLSEVFPINLG